MKEAIEIINARISLHEKEAENIENSEDKHNSFVDPKHLRNIYNLIKELNLVQELLKSKS